MAQQLINYGTSPNDGTGDPLRNAFIKTDDNFDSIWAAGPVGSNLTITNNSISSTSGNITIAASGVNYLLTSNNVWPTFNDTHRLGNTNFRYRGIYVGTEGINATGNVTAGNLVGTVVGNSTGIHTGAVTGDVTGSVFADDSSLLVDGVNGSIPGYVSLSTLQSVTAASTSFADFQARIAAL